MDPGVIGRNEFGCFALDDIRFLDTGGGGLLGRNINAGSKGAPTQAKRGIEWATRHVPKRRSFDSRLNCLLRPKSGRNEFGCFALDDVRF